MSQDKMLVAVDFKQAWRIAYLLGREAGDMESWTAPLSRSSQEILDDNRNTMSSLYDSCQDPVETKGMSNAYAMGHTHGQEDFQQRNRLVHR